MDEILYIKEKKDVHNNYIFKIDILYDYIKKLKKEHQKEISKLNKLVKNIDERNNLLLKENKNLKDKYNNILKLNNKNNCNDNVEFNDIELKKEINLSKGDFYISRNYEENNKIYIQNKCPIYIFNTKNNDIKTKQKYKNIKKKINKEYNKILEFENIDINEIIDNIIKNIKVKNVSSAKNYYRKKIERFIYLNDKYNNMLDFIYFNVRDMVRLSNNDWKIWVNYLNQKTKQINTL